MRPIRTESNQRIRGIPEALPAGERVLWQGRPAWRDLAVTAFHLRLAAIYFGALLVLRLGYLFNEGASFVGALRGALPLTGAALTALALLAGLAFWSSRTTIYAITTRRLVMRVGMALPIDVNLPFSGIESAGLALRKSGHGDLPLVLIGNVHLAYAHLWPFARPWRLLRPEPMLRAVPDAQQIAQLLAQALATSGGVALVPAGAPLAALAGQPTAVAAPALAGPAASPKPTGLAGYGVGASAQA